MQTFLYQTFSFESYALNIFFNYINSMFLKKRKTCKKKNPQSNTATWFHKLTHKIKKTKGSENALF